VTASKTRTRQEQIEALRYILEPGATVHTVLRHVSKSGLSRVLDAYRLQHADATFLTARVADAIGARYQSSPGKPNGLVVSGCGMDMGFHVVYVLSRVLYPTGFGCIGERCPSNDHSNGDRSHVPHGLIGGDREPSAGEAREGLVRHWHRDGGYALQQRWL